MISHAHDTEWPLCEQLDYYRIDYLKNVVVPHKKTILHDYVEAVIMNGYSYLLDKHFPGEVIVNLDECSRCYQLSVDSLGIRHFQFDSDGELTRGDFEDAEIYADSFLDLFQQKLLPTLAEDVFTIRYFTNDAVEGFAKR